jgi:hypothetical protein
MENASAMKEAEDTVSTANINAGMLKPTTRKSFAAQRHPKSILRSKPICLHEAPK